MSEYRYERAQDLLDERLENGVFRCDRCDLVKPLPQQWQDGYALCRRCVDPLSRQESRSLGDYAAAMLPKVFSVDLEPAAIDPPTWEFAGVSSVTGISPATLNLERGGASGQIVLTGVRFTTDDTVEASHASITVTKSVDSTTQITLTISAAGGMTRGDYNLIFNDSTLTPRGILKVR